MPCIRLPSGDPKIPDGFICGFHPVYEFEGYLFEVHGWHGPTPLRRKYLDPRLNTPKGFWNMWDRFNLLPESEKAKHLYKEE